MARNIKQIAEAMDAEIVAKVPETGGGAFGAARLAQIVTALRARLQPSRGIRPGRPTAKDWVVRSKVPMRLGTRRKLRRLARQMSTTERKVSPMQVAAQLLEEAVASCPDE
jgi:hypothetical protein